MIEVKVESVSGNIRLNCSVCNNFILVSARTAHQHNQMHDFIIEHSRPHAKTLEQRVETLEKQVRHLFANKENKPMSLDVGTAAKDDTLFRLEN